MYEKTKELIYLATKTVSTEILEFPEECDDQQNQFSQSVKVVPQRCSGKKVLSKVYVIECLSCF